MFIKYQHVERLGHSEVQDILFGSCYIFYKLDGTNASVWLSEEGKVQGGSRNRELTVENDNAGFYNWVLTNKSIESYLTKYPTHTLYGEWLVPHSLKTYREGAWRQFYIFDVLDRETNLLLPYETYKPLLEECNLEYIPPLAVVKNPTVETLYKCLEKSGEYLVEDGKGTGEGIVVKNYDFVNQYGRQVWAKMVTNEFKEVHHKTMGAPEVNTTRLVEEIISEDYLTNEFVKKEIAKVVNDNGGVFENKLIPQILGRVWYEFVREETWSWVKDLKNPNVNFKTLQSFVYRRVKKELGI